MLSNIHTILPPASYRERTSPAKSADNRLYRRGCAFFSHPFQDLASSDAVLKIKHLLKNCWRGMRSSLIWVLTSRLTKIFTYELEKTVMSLQQVRGRGKKKRKRKKRSILATIDLSCAYCNKCNIIKIQTWFWPISTTCWSPGSFFYASKKDLHSQVISYITLLAVSRYAALQKIWQIVADYFLPENNISVWIQKVILIQPLKKSHSALGHTPWGKLTVVASLQHTVSSFSSSSYIVK